MSAGIFPFVEVKAKAVEQKLHQQHPDNQWSEGYLVNIIKLSCENVDGGYFHGHHGAFDEYLALFGKYRAWCEECGDMFISIDRGDMFCSGYCAREHESWL